LVVELVLETVATERKKVTNCAVIYNRNFVQYDTNILYARSLNPVNRVFCVLSADSNSFAAIICIYLCSSCA
jgi:hypothetical protein